MTSGVGGAHFTTKDNRAFLNDLISKGRFCRDTPGGGILHRGQISVREITDGPALHLSLSDENRIIVHIDSVSPAVDSAPDGTCRYDRRRSLAHIRREVFPFVMRTYRPPFDETKNERRARQELYDAQRAWCEAAEGDRRDESVEAGVRLAGLLAAESESGRRQAQTLYQQAIDSGHSEFVPAAGFGLGILLEESSQIPKALEAYELALGSEHREFAPLAAFNMGILFERLEHFEAAREAFERAVALGHPDITSWAALKLGDLFARLQNPKEALDSYNLAKSLRHPECASIGAVSAARLLRNAGNKDSAKEAYEQAIALGPAETAKIAREELQGMLEEAD